MNKEFHISFDTKEMPGKIVATKVTIEKVIIADMNASMRIDLADHPLYPQLQQYVDNNRRKR
jgi:hypothetical protein